MSDLSNLYFRFGRVDRFNELSSQLETVAQGMIASGQANLNSYYNPYRCSWISMRRAKITGSRSSCSRD